MGGLVSLLLIFGCASKRELPEWVYNYKSKKGQICGVGSAGVHMKGFPYQRATAVARAIDEIARQKNVSVSSSLESYMEGSSSGSTSSLSVYSVQTTEGEVIRARIVESYYNRDTNEFYVLMCEER